jgi:amino acid adenylation domain-containing protein
VTVAAVPPRRVAPANAFAPVDPAVRERSIPERFREQVRAHGARTAIRADGASTTYDELHRRAGRLAAAIRERAGSAEGERIALLIDDPALEVVALLAALEAGHAFVPLDPAHPAPRLAATIADADARLIIADAANLALAGAAGAGRPFLGAEAGGACADAPGARPAPDAPACVIYTSGSTGAPKGVVHTHASLLHGFMNYTNGLRLSADDRFTLFGSCAFAATLSDVFGALLNGGALLPYRLAREGIAGVPAFLARERATIYFSVPTVFRRVVDVLGGGETLEHVRIVKLAGEAVRRSDVERFRRHFPRGALLLNSLGCTEMNIVRQYFVDHDAPLPDGAVPVGYAVPDAAVALLDEAGREVGDGEVGEIAIRSRYLAAGYWRREELTRARFVPAGDRGERIFRTGDLGRLGPGGLLEHLGRKDEQAKIGGVRVDPAEVEGALVEEGLAREAAVVASADGRGEARLAAYVVPGAAWAGPAALRRRLRARLPLALVPAAIVALERLPLLPSGKVDRQALPAPTFGAAPEPGAPARPRDQLEDLLHVIWERALGRAPPGIRDDFFDLGGGSLAALTVCAQVEQLLGTRLGPAALLESPTIEALARTLREGGPAPASPTLVPLERRGAMPPLFLVHPQPGHVLCYAALARRLAPEVPVYGLQAHGIDGREEPDRDLGAVVERYLAAIRAVQPAGPYHLGGWCVGGLIAFEMAQALLARGESVGLVVLCDTYFRRVGLSRVAAEAGRAGRFVRAPLAKLSRVLAERARRREDARRPAPIVRRILDEIMRSHRPRPFAGKLLVLESTEAPRWHGFARARAWLGLARGGGELAALPFDHYEMLAEPGVERVAAIVKEGLRSAARGPGAPATRRAAP